jgi:hypothetical protein
MARLAPVVATVALLAPSALQADEATQAFVESNILATLYHELGHALIDIEGIPIFGQEEDAADVLSVLLIDAFFEEEDAVALAYDTAFGFIGEAERARAEGLAPAYWGVHGPDEQRYYNLVCLFYGADPEERDDVAEDLGLPEERAEYCPDEFDQANEAWGMVLDEMAEAAPGDSFRLGVLDGRYPEIADLIAWEVELLNEDFVLSADLLISLDECGEANAFYDPEAAEITICTEYVDDLATLAP